MKALFSLCRLGAAPAKSLQSCLTLCDPIDGSTPGSPISGILQARIRSGLPCPPHTYTYIDLKIIYNVYTLLAQKDVK